MPRKAEKTFTSRTIAGLPPGEPGGTWRTCADLPGFILRTYPDGSRYFACRYRVKKTGRRRVVSLGPWGLATYTQAHAKAKELLALAALGDDPRPIERTMTWGTWIEKYLSRLDVKRPEEQRRFFGFGAAINVRGEPTHATFRNIRAKWAGRTLDSFTVEDIEEARAEVRERGRILANRWLATVAAAFNAAVRAEILARNPAGKVKADRENPARARVLSREELKALFSALEAEADPYNRAAVALLALTGARGGELLALTWDRVDLEGRRARLDDSKSGKPRTLPLPPRAVEILKALPKLGPFVVPGQNASRPRHDLKGLWARLIKRAGLKDATMHDLRRTWGLEVSRVAGIRIASLGLGHESIAITESTYTPEAFSAIQNAADVVAGRFLPEGEATKEGQP